MTDETMQLVQRLEALNNLGLTKSFAVTACTNASGSTVTCHCRNAASAAALRDLLRSGNRDCVLRQTRTGQNFVDIIVE